jgi:hypothetical protein
MGRCAGAGGEGDGVTPDARRPSASARSICPSVGFDPGAKSRFLMFSRNPMVDSQALIVANDRDESKRSSAL